MCNDISFIAARYADIQNRFNNDSNPKSSINIIANHAAKYDDVEELVINELDISSFDIIRNILTDKFIDKCVERLTEEMRSPSKKSLVHLKELLNGKITYVSPEEIKPTETKQIPEETYIEVKSKPDDDDLDDMVTSLLSEEVDRMNKIPEKYKPFFNSLYQELCNLVDQRYTPRTDIKTELSEDFKSILNDMINGIKDGENVAQYNLGNYNIASEILSQDDKNKIVDNICDYRPFYNSRLKYKDIVRYIAKVLSLEEQFRVKYESRGTSNYPNFYPISIKYNKCKDLIKLIDENKSMDVLRKYRERFNIGYTKSNMKLMQYVNIGYNTDLLPSGMKNMKNKGVFNLVNADLIPRRYIVDSLPLLIGLKNIKPYLRGSTRKILLDDKMFAYIFDSPYNRQYYINCPRIDISLASINIDHHDDEPHIMINPVKIDGRYKFYQFITNNILSYRQVNYAGVVYTLYIPVLPDDELDEDKVSSTN